ncbi:RNA polymerase sigma-70 factor [bacterium]|nr:RNA polymerase sigma-70 factor [bacterium]
MLEDRLQIFEQYRAMLFSMAYRMLGTISDAEDMVQETFLRWHKPSEVDVHAPKSYLATTLTRLCLDHLQSARVKREQYVGPWLPEPVFTQPDLDSRFAESLAMGFLLLMESLSPAERAVFLLREVFEFEFSEIAEIIMKNEQNCRQLVRRARKQISERRPRFETSRADRDRLLNEFVHASSSGDLQGLLRLLKEDATLISDGGGKVAAALNPILGADRVSRFILGVMPKLPAGLTMSYVEVNGVPGIAFYIGNQPHSVIVPEVAGNTIQSIYIISNPDKLKGLLSRPVIS